jgi:hypothetical protein
MHSRSSKRVPPVFPSVAVALLALGLFSCAGKQTGDEGNASEYQPVGAGGPLDSCGASTWTNPDELKHEAGCTQTWDESGDEPVLRYVCSCDLVECPLYGDPIDDEDPNTPPEEPLNDCVVDGVESGCRDSLEAVCGLTEGQHGYCEHPYYGLTPTRPDQDPPTSADVVCFEQPDGTHACDCPAESELVPTPEADCNRALLTACQAPCESDAGRCEPGANGYDCNCTAGFERSVETGLCDYALFYSCEPNCSNEAGSCNLHPEGLDEIICICNDDKEPRIMTRDPNVQGDECLTPLVETCGGSAEGPNAWPQ